jgi:hypothetical protein
MAPIREKYYIFLNDETAILSIFKRWCRKSRPDSIASKTLNSLKKEFGFFGIKLF